MLQTNDKSSIFDPRGRRYGGRLSGITGPLKWPGTRREDAIKKKVIRTGK